MDAMYIFHCCRDAVYRLAVNYTRSPQEAEEVCRTVFARLVEQTGLPAGEELLWLMRTTARECRSRLRDAWWRRLRPLNETVPTPANQTDPATRAVMSLPPEYRVVLYLRYYEDYTTAEIGQLLELSVRTVTARLSRGRDWMRAKLGEE